MAKFIPPRHRISQIGDPVLRLKCEEVEDFNGELFDLVKRLERAAKENRGIGAAAPQVGVNQRVFAWNAPEIGVGHIINPRIEMTSGTVVASEGCLSIPGFFFDVERPAEVLLSGQYLDGSGFHQAATGLLARLFLHEMDHLDGILLVDRIDDEQWRRFRDDWTKKTGRPCPGDWRQKVGDGS